jgi:UTP:GlnB (protein PII) uridylyltransferase
MEIVVENALGLLHQISQAISSEHCDIELVLISTQGVQALDVFHLTSDGEKLSDATQASLEETLHSTLQT